MSHRPDLGLDPDRDPDRDLGLDLGRDPDRDLDLDRDPDLGRDPDLDRDLDLGRESTEIQISVDSRVNRDLDHLGRLVDKIVIIDDRRTHFKEISHRS